MLIAQMTDIHIGFEPDAKPEELNRVRFRAALDRVLKQPSGLDMLVLSGDLTDRGDRDSFDKLTAELKECPVPIYPLVGNHDSREELRHAFPDVPYEGDFIHYAIEQDGLRILFLDTFEPGRHGGAFCEQRAEWLAQQLQAHPDTPTLIFMHHPPIVSGIEWMDPSPSEDWMQRLGDTVEGHSQIQAIHCGHVHRQIMTSFRGIPLSVVPSVAPPVALDLRSISSAKPDSRALITTEPPCYALHRWDGQILVSHIEMVSDWDVLAWYGPHLQPMIREFENERKGA